MTPAVTRIAPPDWMTWPETRAVMAALTATGQPARFVGGCVRDAVLGRPVADVDIATPLTPEAVIEALAAAGLRAIPTGIEHGTVTALAGERRFEITTLRVDVATDGRHATVAFTDDWREDAARRDFTMNALSAEPDGTVHDYFGGVADARAGRVRFVGDPRRRIEEDALRILRFFRFYAHYGRPPADAAAVAACARAAARIEGLSGERVRAELFRLLAAADPVPAWRLMAETGVARHVIGESGDMRRLAALVGLEQGGADPLRRLAALLSSPAAAAPLPERLRLSRAERDRLLALVDRGTELSGELSVSTVRRLAYAAGPAITRDRLLLAWADDPTDRRYRDLLDSLEGWEPPEFPLTGQDVIDRGLPPGPAVGAVLRRLECWWLAHDLTPGRADCLAELDRVVAGELRRSSAAPGAA